VSRFARLPVAVRDALWAEARRWGRPVGLSVLVALVVVFRFALFEPRGAELIRIGEGQPAADDGKRAALELGPPDGRKGGYSPPELEQYAEALSAGGRERYVETQKAYDLVFPLVYGSLFAAGLAAGWGRLGRTRPRVRWLVAVPLAAMLADYGENLTVIRLFTDYPAHWSAGLARLAEAFTLTKWGFVHLMAYALVPVGLVVRVVQCCGDCRRPGAGGPAGS
jgi:hypothetical protein